MQSIVKGTLINIFSWKFCINKNSKSVQDVNIEEETVGEPDKIMKCESIANTQKKYENLKYRKEV